MEDTPEKNMLCKYKTILLLVLSIKDAINHNSGYTSYTWYSLPSGVVHLLGLGKVIRQNYTVIHMNASVIFEFSFQRWLELKSLLRNGYQLDSMITTICSLSVSLLRQLREYLEAESLLVFQNLHYTLNFIFNEITCILN